MNDLIEEFNILIPEILKFYDLGNFEKILNFINYKKYQNIVLIFQTSKGKYILKEYRRGRNINDIKYKLNLIASLLLNPKLKLTLVLNKENKSYVEFNDRIFSIDKYIENFEKEFDYEERLINLAIFLASFHKEG